MSYQLVFSVFEEIIRAENSNQLDQKLKSLQPFVKSLRELYKLAPDITVQSPYGAEPSRNAYLLAYVPKYIEQAERSFRLAAPTQPDPDSTYKAAFFCCGPAPEATALIRHFSSKDFSLNFEFHFFDIHPEWAHIRTLLLKKDGTSIRNLGAFEYEIDITQADIHETHLDVLRQVDIVTFQNCLNELAGSEGINNVYQICKNLKSGAQMILSDLSGYQENRNDFENLKSELEDLSGTTKFHKNEQAHVSDYPEGLLKRHLLDGSDGLRPSTKSNFSLLTYTNIEDHSNPLPPSGRRRKTSGRRRKKPSDKKTLPYKRNQKIEGTISNIEELGIYIKEKEHDAIFFIPNERLFPRNTEINEDEYYIGAVILATVKVPDATPKSKRIADHLGTKKNLR